MGVDKQSLKIDNKKGEKEKIKNLVLERPNLK